MFLQAFLGFIGRACLSLIFILSAMHKIFHWQQVEEQIVDVLSKVMARNSGIVEVESLLQWMVSWVSLVLIVIIFLELAGGVFMFLGVKVRLAAFFLILFLIPVTLLCHPFWQVEGAERSGQMIMFLKNVAIFGGLLQLLAYGNRSAAPQKKSASSEK